MPIKTNSQKNLTQGHFNIIIIRQNKLHYRGVAQMVACLFRVQEAMGSNPVTPTKKNRNINASWCFCFLFIDGI